MRDDQTRREFLDGIAVAASSANLHAWPMERFPPTTLWRQFSKSVERKSVISPGLRKTLANRTFSVTTSTRISPIKVFLPFAL
jgi:hypothetical protein